MRWIGVAFATLSSLTAHGSEQILCCRYRRFRVCAVSLFRSNVQHSGGITTKQTPVCLLARLSIIYFEPGAPVVIPSNGIEGNSTAFCFITRILSRAFRNSTVRMSTERSSGKKTTSLTNQAQMQPSARNCNSVQSFTHEITEANLCLGEPPPSVGTTAR